MAFFSIAIDGPTGAGKSTIAREISKRLGCIYIDTGAMYRAIGLHVRRQGIASDAADQILPLLKSIVLSIEHIGGEQHIFLNGEDVSSLIRSPEMSIYASNVSKIPQVRSFLLDTQRGFAETGNVVMDGRDIGTVVLPDADVKIFLTASRESRAARRHMELKTKGIASMYDEVLKDLIWRDANDQNRASAPLKAAEDAVTLDTTDLSFAESVDEAERLIRLRIDSISPEESGNAI